MNFARLILLYFLIVNVACVSIFFIPELKPLLSASYQNLDLASIAKYYTSNFVHGNETHLLGNILGFNVVGALLYAICWCCRKEKELFCSLISMLILLPLISNLILFLFLMRYFASTQSCGLSAFVSALVGLLLPASVVCLGPLNPNKRCWLWLSLYLLTASLIAFQYADFHQNLSTYIPLAMFIVATVILGLVAKDGFSETREEKLRVVFLALTMLVYFGFVYFLFPSNFVVGSILVNILAHAIGLLFGMFIGSYTFKVWR
ncbi:MAG: hypothetical protein ACK401_00705 [Archaeoglobaceae archaeon]